MKNMLGMDIANYNKKASTLQAYYGRRTRFVSLMELYEQNYIRLRNLIPDIKDRQGCYTSHVTGCLDLQLNVLEQCKYTSMINLTYQFDCAEDNAHLGFSRNQYEPNLEIRVYHDARQAECCEGTFHSYVQNSALVSENKWYLNRFLYKWLAYCLERGHRFATGTEGVDENYRTARFLLTGFSTEKLL